MNMIKEFFGIGGFQRVPEGAYSWQHLTFVGLLLTAMVALAVWLGVRNRKWNFRTQNRVMIWAAVLIDGLELIKIGLSCYESTLEGDAWYVGLRTVLPLFLCSIQLIVIPLAAFTRGRLREVAADFVALFGLLGGILGTVGAAQNYNAYPVLSFTNMVSGFTHCIAGFASLYVIITGLATLKRRNIVGTFTLLFAFCGAAMAANHWLDYNYMFLRSHDGTPYQIFYNLVGGHPVWYPFIVILLFVVYMSFFYAIALLIQGVRKENTPITTRVVLSFLTYGIYTLCWKYQLVKRTRTMQGDDKGHFLEWLCLVCIPFYAVYWWYSRGKRIKIALTAQGQSSHGKAWWYVALWLCGLEIVALAVMQRDMNVRGLLVVE